MISIIVNLYNMRREAARTLHSLCCDYQRRVTPDEYEVIVIENGSDDPVGAAFVESFGPQFRYLDMGSEAMPSPVRAVNHAVEEARGDRIGIILDGARMCSPGLLSAARDALRIFPRTIVGTIAWHLGDEHQSISSGRGYTQKTEDEILAALDWQADGYRLFRRAAWAFSNPTGHFGSIAESCATFMSRKTYEAVGGYDDAFTLPGGGYANLDFFKRCCALDESRFVLLAGEGTFHQYHGGATTGLDAAAYGSRAAQEYLSIRGVAFRPPALDPILFGTANSEVLPWFEKSLEANLRQT